MGCRVGITTNIEERKKYWKMVHPTLKAWSFKGPFSREVAQAYEIKIKEKFQCDGGPGGTNPYDKTDDWFVYYFEY